MKKILFALALIILSAGAQQATAQTKIGYLNFEDVLSLMPELNSIDSMLTRYQQDSINPEYASMLQMYKYKDSIYNDTLNPPPAAVKKQLEQELPQLQYTLQNWQQIANRAMENKQGELLAPLYRKINDAVRAIAKEKGYTHVMNKSAFLVAPDADDMFTAVTNRLKLNVPKAPAGGR